MQLNACAKLVLQIQALAQQSSAQVNIYRSKYNLFYELILDSCQVNNGGCDRNSICSRDAKTNAIECICKTGYTNTGLGAAVVCTGNL